MGRRTEDRGKDLMSADEVANAAGISQETVRKLIKQGELKTIQTEKRSYISRLEYERWLKGEERVTGFDSEADRRDAIRKQIVDLAYDAAMTVIVNNCILRTQEERTYIQAMVIERFAKGLCLETMSQVFRQEIATAEQEIESDS